MKRLVLLLAGVAAMLALTAGGVLAAGRAEGRPGDRPVPEGRAMMRGRGRMPQRGPLQMMFAGADNLEVRYTDDGAVVHATADDPRQVEILKQRIDRMLDRLDDLAIRMEEERRDARRPEGMGMMGWLARGDLKIEADELDNGVAVRFRAEDPDLAALVQEEIERLPQGRMDAMPAGMPGEEPGLGREALMLLASERVRTQVQRVPGGIAFTVTAADEETVDRIREELEPYFAEMQERLRQRMRAMEERRERRPQALEEERGRLRDEDEPEKRDPEPEQRERQRRRRR